MTKKPDLYIPGVTNNGKTIAVSTRGPRGFSSYDIAVEEGFEGTEAEWLETLGPGQAAVDQAVATTIARDGSRAPTDTIDFDGQALVGLPAPEDPTAPLRAGDRDRLVESHLHGREHGPELRGWLAARADQSRPARVVLVADSMGELSNGWGEVWRRMTTAAGGGDEGRWTNAFWVGFRSWTGTYDASTVGIDGRGGAVTFGSGVVGPDPGQPLVPIPQIPTTLDIYYTASTSGGEVGVTIDGQVVDTFDTRLDEDGSPVSADLPGQRWRSPHVGKEAYWSIEVIDSGTALIEGVVCPPAVAGVEVHGMGRSGQSTAQASPRVLAHVDAMVARGEAPDLIVLAADTAESGSSAAAAVEDLVPELRARVPEASIVWMVPSGHANWGSSEAAQEAHADAIRDAAHGLGLPLIDLYAAMGPVWAGHDPHGWSSDTVHHTARGIAAAVDVFSDVLASRSPRTDARVAGAIEAARQGVEDAETARQLAQDAYGLADAALPTSGGTLTGQIVGASLSGQPSLRAVHPMTSPAGGVAVRLDDASHDSIVLGHFLGIPSIILSNPASGSQLGAVTGAAAGVQVSPRLQMAAASDPAAPSAGNGVIWLRSSGELCYRGPGGAVVVLGSLTSAPLLKSGGALTGPVEMSGNSLTGLPAPADVTAPVRLGDTGVVVDPAGQGRQHGPPMVGWLDALTRAERGERPARVVYVADSMGELTGGLSQVWDGISRQISGDTGGWQPPYFATTARWFGMDGTPTPIGLDRKGATIAAGTTAFGPFLAPDPIPTTLDVWYTAHPSGADVEVRVAGDLIGTIDTSLDENGDAVSGEVPHQRWRSPHVGQTAYWTLSVVGTGTLMLEAVARPTASIDRIGSGLSGTTTAVSTAPLLAMLAELDAKGEPPDMVVLHADTAESGVDAAAAVAALVPQIRALCPDASIVHVIPHGHHNWGSTAASQEAHWEQHRRNDAALGVGVVDLYAAMGPVWSGHDPYGWCSDSVHWSAQGQAAASAVVLDVLASRRVGSDAATVARAADAQQRADDAHDLASDALPASTDAGVLHPPDAVVLGGLFPGVAAGIGKPGEPHPRLALSLTDFFVGLVTGDGSSAPGSVGVGITPTEVTFPGRAIAMGDQRVKGLAPAVALEDAVNQQQAGGGYPVAVSSSRVLTPTDRGTVLICSAAVTITIDHSMFVAVWPEGMACRIVQAGTGAVTIAVSGGAVLRSPGGAASTGQGQEGILRRISVTDWSINWIG